MPFVLLVLEAGLDFQVSPLHASQLSLADIRRMQMRYGIRIGKKIDAMDTLVIHRIEVHLNSCNSGALR